ncbi:hypothetical protein [Paraburkholderia sp. JHI869]|uniref:hypothetical protein n=1 Tax=Paraburkholderia sp. JHI869 TaxID=3112959 RepID=UPI00317A2552
MYQKVIQRRYQVAKAGTRISVLETGDVWTCTSFAGVNKQGIGFLAHFDGGISTGVIDEIIEELKKLDADFSTFELRIATGLAGYVNPANWPTRIGIWWHVRKSGLFKTDRWWKRHWTEIWSLRFWWVFGVVVDTNTRTIKRSTFYHHTERKGEWVPRPPKGVNCWYTRWKAYRVGVKTVKRKKK